jgi:purine-binding chemotaxis protein CheW
METNKQYFLFISNNDIYAIEALDVIEIVEYQNITKVPMMSNFVKGVTNIRGNIIAVVDLLQRFELEETKVLDKTSLAILRKKHLDKELQIAIIIDEVYEVDNISDVNIEHTPNFGTRVDKKFIKSMAKYNDEFVPILDIDAILDIEEISVLTAFKKDK